MRFFPLFSDEILSQIQLGELAVGSMIPSEWQLSNYYHVSRNTAQKAIQDLVHKGVLTRKKGLGTFVASPKIEQKLGRFYSFSEALKMQGIESSVKVVSLKKGKAFKLCAQFLEITTKQEVNIFAGKYNRIFSKSGAVQRKNLAHMSGKGSFAACTGDRHRNLNGTLWTAYAPWIQNYEKVAAVAKRKRKTVRD